MNDHALSHGTHRISPSEPDSTLANMGKAQWVVPHPTPARVLLAHPLCLFGLGLAALLAARPGLELLPQVADGEAALETIYARVPEVALLNLDLDKIPGIEVARRVHAAGLATRCLMLVTEADPALAAETMDAGAAGCLVKDSSIEELHLALHTLGAGRIFMSPAIATRLLSQRGSGHGVLALSPREREIVRLLAAGQSSKRIARTLDISPDTVDTHRRRLLRKLGLHTSTEVVRYAAENGLLG